MALVGSGSATPQLSISNDQISRRVETNDDWIRSRTGIRERCIVDQGSSLTALATNAGQKALDMAGWGSDEVDLILLATSTPDDLFGMAPAVQAALGNSRAVAFDLTAACSGFLFAMVTAAQFLQTGTMRKALVIAADQLSRWVDWNDRRTCVLFGDGAGALAMEAVAVENNGLLGFRICSDGARGDCLNLPQTQTFLPLVDGHCLQQGGYQPIQMNGQEVYKFAVREVPALLEKVMTIAGISPSEIDWLLLHQANQRILDAVAARFSIPAERVLSNLAVYGNTSAATIPLMLDEAVRDGRVRPGQCIASSGFGAGLSWGAALLRWEGPN